MSEDEGIKVKRADNFSEWFVEVVRKGEFADYSSVKGCMVVKPNGYFIWQQIQDFLNSMIAKDGVRNAYFPLFIPESLLKKESTHFEGFTPEVAWTGGKTDEEGSERLAIRPTSETIICSEVAGWVRSHRDFPVRLNQWCSVVRWETKTTRLFLRTREFLWQEGHTFWAEKKGAEEEVLRILDYYRRVAEELLAVPVVKGMKTETEKFAGAEYTMTIEALMPDGKALQSGTSHYLGTGFSKAFGVKFLDEDNTEKLAYYNTWGISTRLIGGLLMTHSDDKGAVIPPRVAETQVVVIPIYFRESQAESILAEARRISSELSNAGIRAKIDERTDKTPGWKFNHYELIGVPLRIEIGPKDVEGKTAMCARRDTGEKSKIPFSSITTDVKDFLDKIQLEMFQRAKKRAEEMTINPKTKEEFDSAIEGQKGFVVAPWCGEALCEKEFGKRTGASIRLVPLGKEGEGSGHCLACGKEAKKTAYFAKAY